jgi:hypothetical protein
VSLMFASSSAFWEPLRVPRDLTNQLLARAHQRTEVLDRRRWNETASNQSVREKIGDPRSVLHVRLASRHVLDMRRVRQNELKLRLQDVPDRLPSTRPSPPSPRACNPSLRATPRAPAAHSSSCRTSAVPRSPCLRPPRGRTPPPSSGGRRGPAHLLYSSSIATPSCGA